jgi:hypothetical protein
MKKRDVIIFALLVVLVIVFTAWEVANKREREAKIDSARRAERALLEKRLAEYDLEMDSLTIEVLRIVDSLKTEAAAFEALALARQAELELQANRQPDTQVVTIEPRSAPPDTLPNAVRAAYQRALDGLPADLTRYERKIAVKEVENTILARFDLTREEFISMKESWSSSP